MIRFYRLTEALYQQNEFGFTLQLSRGHSYWSNCDGCAIALTDQTAQLAAIESGGSGGWVQLTSDVINCLRAK